MTWPKIEFTGQWCDRHRDWSNSPDDEKCFSCHEEDAAKERERQRAIRAVVAAQWAVACAIAAWRFEDWRSSWEGHAQADCASIEALAALPTPEQIVDGAA